MEMIYKVWHHNDRLHSPWLHSISNAIPVYIQHGILAPLGGFFFVRQLFGCNLNLSLAIEMAVWIHLDYSKFPVSMANIPTCMQEQSKYYASNVKVQRAPLVIGKVRQF